MVVVCRDRRSPGRERFGIPALGCVYTEKGRPFCDDSAQFLAELRDGLTRSGLMVPIQNGLGMSRWQRASLVQGQRTPVAGKPQKRSLAGVMKYDVASPLLMEFAAGDQSAERNSLSRYRNLCDDLSSTQPVFFQPEACGATEESILLRDDPALASGEPFRAGPKRRFTFPRSAPSTLRYIRPRRSRRANRLVAHRQD